MVDASQDEARPESAPAGAAIDRFREDLSEGRDWPTSLLEAMALWTAPRESVDRRDYDYFIAGEAFDWLLLAERLCAAVDGLVPQQEAEELLFHGRFPDSFDPSAFRDLLGIDKYRGYLNYYYGVTVEEALQLATELEVLKRQASNGVHYKDDNSDEAYARIYRAPKSDLLQKFRAEIGYSADQAMSLGESREFTYWLFKHRMRVSDKAKIASDTRKGLEQLQRMKKAPQAAPSSRAAAEG